MLGMLAEIYIDNLRQETQKGKLQRARDGWWNGNIPLGYCRGLCSRCDDPNGPGYCPDVGKPDKSDGRLLVIHPIDGKAVRTAFALYLNEVQSNVLIAEKLNQTTFCLADGTQMTYRQKGITGRKEPSPYTKDFVRGMLSQVFYTGKVAYYGRGRKRKIEALFPGKHPVLIPEADFQRAMEIRESIGLVGRSKNNKVPTSVSSHWNSVLWKMWMADARNIGGEDTHSYLQGLGTGGTKRALRSKIYTCRSA